jgi:hypothetical protein
MTVGRNDPCPCGSGKKYKKCCADKDAAARSAELAAQAQSAEVAAAAAASAEEPAKGRGKAPSPAGPRPKAPPPRGGSPIRRGAV